MKAYIEEHQVELTDFGYCQHTPYAAYLAWKKRNSAIDARIYQRLNGRVEVRIMDEAGITVIQNCRLVSIAWRPGRGENWLSFRYESIHEYVTQPN